MNPRGTPRVRGTGSAAAAVPVPTPPAALTIITGSEQFLVDRARRRVIAAIELDTPDADHHHLDAADPACAASLPEALSPSLFNSRAVVVITGFESVSEGTLAVILRSVADLGDSRVVVVHAGQKGRRAVDTLAAASVAGGVAVVECLPVKKGRAMRDFLQAEAATAGRRLSAEAAELLMTAVGGNIALLVGALEQLLWDFPDDPLGADEVTTMFTGVAEVSGFQFSDAVWDRDSAAALAQLRWGEATSTLSPPAATGAAAAGLRALVRVASAPRGLSDADVARIAGVPSFKVRMLRAQAERWAPQELAQALVGLAAADGAVKGGLRPGENLEPGQKSHTLENWVRNKGRRPRD